MNGCRLQWDHRSSLCPYFPELEGLGKQCKQERAVCLAGRLPWPVHVQLRAHTLAGADGPCGPRCSRAPLREAATGPPPQCFRFAGMPPPPLEKCTLFPSGGGASGLGSRAPWDLEGGQLSVPRVPSGGGEGCLHPSWAAGGYWTRLDSRVSLATH